MDYDADPSAARYDLAQLEQTRWVLSGLLEIKDLNTIWPVRVLITSSVKPSPGFSLHDGCYVLVKAPGASLPLGEVAHLFLEANTPRLPAEVESGLPQLFDTLKANGSRVTWGGPPAKPSLDYARMQLFATKFEYGASFHIFINSLRSGSTLKAAERNAFGRDPGTLEQEAAARLAAQTFEAVSANGRPLDPKRDFGEHSLDSASARVYAASTLIAYDADAAEAALKNAMNEGGPAVALALDSLAGIARARGENPSQFLADAMQAGSKDAAVYLAAAQNLPPDQSRPLLKKAALLNPLWSEPVYRQALITDDLNEREALLKRAIQMNLRSSDYWVALAKTQMANNHAVAAQSSWVRAEDSAPDPATRESVARMHESLENERLDAAASERSRERNEAVLADQRAQQAESDRIRAAEDKANQASVAQAASSTGSETVDWNSLAKTQKTYGYIVMVDCRKDYVRLAVRDLRGKTRQLLYDVADQKLFSCENKPEKRQIVVTFRPHDDSLHGTDGDIVSVAWR